MNRIEPGWGFADTNAHENIDGQAADLLLPIALGSRFSKSWGEIRARSFEAKGSVQLSGTSLAIRTSVSRLLDSAIRNDLTLRFEDIYNVRVRKRLVRFDLVNGPGELEPVILRTQDHEDAVLLAASLPAQTTRTYATEQRVESLFLGQMKQRTPFVWVTWVIVAITSLVFIVMAANGAGVMRVNPVVAIAWGSNFGPYTQDGQWWRLLTAVFIHFGLVHIVFNMLALVQFGRLAERFYGSGRFIAIYLFAGIAASMMSLLMHPGFNCAGASGAIFGVIGAVLAYLLLHRQATPRGFYVKHFRLAAWFTVYALINGLTHPGVDNGAHVGGLLGGFLFGLVIAPPLEPASPRSVVARAMAIGAPAVLAGGFLVSLAAVLAMLDRLPERQESMQFSELILKASELDRRAVADLKTMPRDHSTPQARAALAERIRSTLLPEWRQLDTMFATARLTPDTPSARTRLKILTYYDDMSQELELTAMLAEQNLLSDPASKAALQRLIDEARRARVEATKTLRQRMQ
ncbi:rhomboid protease GluP [Paraburkholderia bannensis]|uniref:Rhomboid protease GluP n=1 Tax=Paraburkholderia bannensis TaxID=765414 RepID=A0A7W9WUG3_9BURK|nr:MULTISPECIES: rhomboid family intramembrane serine protease [Paraburkholderia]MBB3259336.1 rhomboid protease GluP [Paraburkholderia sp. WP4_3_2]MBB6104352.1 rhomboid protease GluP [Paraburkholderia bannensis]